MTGSIYTNIIATNSSATSEYSQTPSGFTLVGIIVPVELASTTFTIAQSLQATGIYTTLKDPLGLYTAAAGNDVLFTLGATSLGTFLIPPIVAAGLSSFTKIILGSAESAALTLIYKQLS